MGVEDIAADEAPEVLAVFAGAAHARPRRPLRLVGGLVAAAFAVVSLAVVATHDRTGHVAGGLSVPGEGPASGIPAPTRTLDAVVPTTTGSTQAEQVAHVLGPLAPALGLNPSEVSTFGSGAVAAGAGGAGPGAPGSPATTIPRDPKVAVLSPTLKVFAFGSKVGLPLLCNVAFSAVIAQIPDPSLAQVATTIVTSCVNGGTQGAAALQALNVQLGALEAVNPAVSPLVDALVATFNGAGAPGVPFSQSLTALGKLIAYFSAVGP